MANLAISETLLAGLFRPRTDAIYLGALLRESSGVEDVSSELHQAREYIRSLSSVNSELRSQIEVLSSR